MRNDFKIIVFKQLTISIKTQNDNIIKVSCSVNQQNDTLHLKHDCQYRRNFKSLNINMTANIVGTLNLST
jgi:hypothetical protein